MKLLCVNEHFTKSCLFFKQFFTLKPKKKLGLQNMHEYISSSKADIFRSNIQAHVDFQVGFGTTDAGCCPFQP